MFCRQPNEGFIPVERMPDFVCYECGSVMVTGNIGEIDGRPLCPQCADNHRAADDGEDRQACYGGIRCK